MKMQFEMKIKEHLEKWTKKSIKSKIEKWWIKKNDDPISKCK